MIIIIDISKAKVVALILLIVDRIYKFGFGHLLSILLYIQLLYI